MRQEQFERLLPSKICMILRGVDTNSGNAANIAI